MLNDRWQKACRQLAATGVSLAAPCPEPVGPLMLTWITSLAAMTAGSAGEAIAADPSSVALQQLAGRVAATRATVLITGPTGAGKEVLARSIHHGSPRAEQAFVAINCAALPDAMLEALLFGHERGAFTGAAVASGGLFRAADGGTLFLDEIGELPLALQAKLLRAIQEREVMPLGATRPVAVDVRLVSASNRDLHAAVAAGLFREDLLWRLAVFPLDIQPLSARTGDIVPLAAALLRRLGTGSEGLIPVPTEPALQRLVQHNWPGNVRELDNVLQRAAILSSGGIIGVEHLLFSGPANAAVAALPAPARLPPFESALAGAIRTREAETIQKALAASGGQRMRAAADLGISERTLRYKLAALAGRPRDRARNEIRIGSRDAGPASLQ